MNTKLFKTTAIATLALMATFNSCKKEDDEFVFPESDIQLNNNIVVNDTMVNTYYFYRKLNSQSTYGIKMFLGTSVDNLIEVENSGISLKYFTQYYWQIKAYNNGEYSTPSPIQTFYCVPKAIQLNADNGSGAPSAILHWTEAGGRFQNKKIKLKSKMVNNNAEMELNVPDSDSIFVVNQTETQLPYMIQDYDDEVGQYYEPIIYQFKLTADVQVGDTTFSIASNEIDEILLDGDKYVRDHEFNVYRIVKIGEQVWMADDLRCTTYNDNGTNEHFFAPDEGRSQQLDYNSYKKVTSNKVDYLVSNIDDKETGILYLLKNRDAFDLLSPKGYHISTLDDWEELIKYYGGNMIANDTDDPWTNYHSDVNMNQLLSSYYWPDSIINKNNNNGMNIKPFGYGYIHPVLLMYSTKYRYDKELREGTSIEYYVSQSFSIYIYPDVFSIRRNPNDSDYLALRCVKNEE